MAAGGSAAEGGMDGGNPVICLSEATFVPQGNSEIDVLQERWLMQISRCVCGVPCVDLRRTQRVWCVVCAAVVSVKARVSDSRMYVLPLSHSVAELVSNKSPKSDQKVAENLVEMTALCTNLRKIVMDSVDQLEGNFERVFKFSSTADQDHWCVG